MTDLATTTQQHQRDIIRANEQLEHAYLRRADPTVALLLTRNYNFLTQQQNQTKLRLSFLQKTKFWWQCYLKLSTGKKLDLKFLLDCKQPLFKSIAI